MAPCGYAGAHLGGSERQNIGGLCNKSRAGANLLQQQAKFDAFVEEFNCERPHEALAMQCPGQVYTASTRPYHGIPDPHYPFHDKTVVVTNCGRLCLFRKKINLSSSLAGQAVGVKEVDDGIWLVSFMNYDPWLYRLGGENPAAPRKPFRGKSVTRVSGTFCYLCLRTGQRFEMVGREDLNLRPPGPEPDYSSY